MTAQSFLYYEMVKKRDIGGGGQHLGIWRYVTFERPLYTDDRYTQVDNNVESNIGTVIDKFHYSRSSQTGAPWRLLKSAPVLERIIHGRKPKYM